MPPNIISYFIIICAVLAKVLLLEVCICVSRKWPFVVCNQDIQLHFSVIQESCQKCPVSVTNVTL